MFGLRHIVTRDFIWNHAIAVLLMLLMTVASSAFCASAKEIKQKTFGSPEEAMEALAETVAAGDSEGLLAVLGPEAEEIVSSGDEVYDKQARERFMEGYRQKVEVVKESKDRVSIILGNDNWPFPIPIVKEDAGWFFDTAAAKEELLNRRIGRNELNAIQTCLAYVDAQQEYASVDRDRDGVIEYARKFFSDEGRRDGLYWEVSQDEQPSPVGPLLAVAASEGYDFTKSSDESRSYQGYYYKILEAQGPDAPGGAYSYVINGNMVAGFALVAWPALYGQSGIMTFIVNQNGIVYEIDLGAETAKTAGEMTQYNPDPNWRRAQ